MVERTILSKKNGGKKPRHIDLFVTTCVCVCVWGGGGGDGRLKSKYLINYGILPKGHYITL